MLEMAMLQSTDFDYDIIDRHLAQRQDIKDHAELHRLGLYTAEDMAFALSRIGDWIVQTVPRVSNGIEIRGTIFGWKTLPHLRQRSLTDIAAMVGRDKQSIGRWHDDWKRTFEA